MLIKKIWNYIISKFKKRHSVFGFLNKNWILVTACVLLVLGFSTWFSLSRYFSTFGSGYSKKSQDWGAFGSYLGGTLGILFTAANIFMFIMLGVKIHVNEQTRWLAEIRIKSFESMLIKLQSINTLTCKDKKILAELKVYLD